MKTVEIQIPEGYELKQVSESKWKLVTKERTLEQLLQVTHPASIATPFGERNINFRTIDQLDRVEAMLKLMCVADYLNNGWKPNWSLLTKEDKWCIEYIKNTGEFYVECYCNITYGQVLFKTKELALKAIEICGKELLKVAFGLQK